MPLTPKGRYYGMPRMTGRRSIHIRGHGIIGFVISRETGTGRREYQDEATTEPDFWYARLGDLVDDMYARWVAQREGV